MNKIKIMKIKSLHKNSFNHNLIRSKRLQKNSFNHNLTQRFNNNKKKGLLGMNNLKNN